NLLIGFEHATEIAAEAILVELVLGLDVPEAARIRRDLVGDDDPHQVVFPEATALDLEVDELDADAEEEAGEEGVDADRGGHAGVALLWVGPAEGGDVLLGNHRVLELVVLVIELDDRAG